MKSAFTLAIALGVLSSAYAGIVSQSLLDSFGSKNKTVIFEFPSILSKLSGNPVLEGLSGNDKAEKIVSMLKSGTKAMQGPIINSLKTLGISSDQITPFWVTNKIAVKNVGFGLLSALSAIPGPFSIREEYEASAFPVANQNYGISKRQTSDLQWGVRRVNASAAWDAGYTGQGIVVGIIDTGVNGEHEALRGNYRNMYGWKDGYGQHSEPYDGQGHGTHCAGSAVGQANGIGVAPGAEWIACRGLDDNGRGSESALSACGQWMACPSETDECLGRPHIVSNSWGGTGGQTWYNEIIQTWQQLGIIPIFAIGNSGPLCNTQGSPGDQPNVISVGSTDPDDRISSFSSRGSPFARGENINPEVAAPGRDIVSARHDDNSGYTSMSGTSMATPHVAGVVALMLSANSNMGYSDVLGTLQHTTDKPTLRRLNMQCAFSFKSTYPNVAYGAGIVNVGTAMAGYL